uniref:RNA polymerase Rpb4/RPC9 core domain-containing protein n=1 Tax=Setaria viridis TaxID=4556 RepID=A0A4U6W7J3_SETVI|nr:LOW QUALITY PROTEIN: hypothetical protein SEVIR_1G113300v2 [Setaria viridis]
MSGEEENAAELKIGEGSLSFTSPILLPRFPSPNSGRRGGGGDHPGAQYEQIQQHVSESDPSSQVSQVFEKSLQYVKRFSRYKNPDAVRQVCKTLRRYGLAEFELCTLGNLCQDTRGETTALVPSLKSGGRFVGKAGNEKIEKMLTDLSLIKKFE